MPTITLQVGQCGNQLGDTWSSLLFRQQQQLEDVLQSTEWYRTVDHPGGAGQVQYTSLRRVVSVDSEAKVVKTYDSESTKHQTHVLGHGGCGNNWAYGYQYGQNLASQKSQSSAWSRDAEDGITNIQQVLTGVRKECEAAHGVPDFLMFASLAGGTGSGLGSAILEALSDEYPASTIAAVAVAPGKTGDSAMQSINSCLALQHLDLCAHAIILIDNQAYLDQLNKQFSNSSSSSTSSTGSLSTSTTSTRMQTLQPGARTAAAAGRGWDSGARKLAAQDSGQATVTGRACLSDVNLAAAEALVGLLWPLDSEQPAGSSNLRRLASTICADPLYKAVELCHISQTERQWTASSSSNPWPARVQLLSSQLPKFDLYQPSQAVTTSGAWLIMRGMPGTWTASAEHSAVGATDTRFSSSSSVGCSGGWFRPSLQQNWNADNLGSSGWQRDVTQAVCSKWPHFSGCAADVHLSYSPNILVGSSKQRQPSITAAVRRSSTGTLMQAAAQRALQLCEAGAYMHWFERYGCDRQSIRDAAHAVADMAMAYLV